MRKTIEMIVPCCNEEECVSIFYNKIKEVFESQLFQYDFKILFIDDGSKDKTLERIKKFS